MNHFWLRLLIACMFAWIVCNPDLLKADDTTDTRVLGGIQYVRDQGRWFVSHGGQLTEEVILDTLILRRLDKQVMTDSEFEDLGLTLKQVLVEGYAVATINPPADPFTVVANLIDAQYEVFFDRYLNFYGRPNDLYFLPADQYEGQWNLERIGMPAAWDTTKGSPDVIVAVSDSGVDLAHPELASNLWINPLEIPNNGLDDDHNGWIDDPRGWDFEHNDNNPAVNEHGFGHGTWVAGIIFSRCNNGQGLAGIAGGWSQRGASMLPLLTDLELSNLMSSVLYSVKTGAHVVNISWGAVAAQPPLEDLITFLAANYDCTFICAAGNDRYSQVSTPARLPATIAVGSCDKNDRQASNSFGPELDLVAPVTIVTTDVLGEPGISPEYLTFWWNAVNGVFSLDYFPVFGNTSSAAPTVTGVVALMLAVNPGLSPLQIRDVLRASADKVGPYNYNWSPSQPGQSQEMGYGRLRADRALNLALLQPTVQATIPVPGAYFATGAQVAISWTGKNFTGAVKVSLYNSRGFVRTLAASVAGSSLTWTNPGDLVSDYDYRIKLESISNPAIYDYSDRPFGLEGLAVVGIPDDNLLEALLASGYDFNGDQRIDSGEASRIVVLDISQSQIENLSGLQYFDHLRELDCSHNQITDMGPVALNQAFMARCDKRIDFSYNLLGTYSAYGVCELACSSWRSFIADHQAHAENCLCWNPPCGELQ